MKKEWSKLTDYVFRMNINEEKKMLEINSSEKGIKEVALLRSSKCNDLWRQKGMKVDQLGEFVCTQTYERRMNDLWMMRWILSVMLWSMFETHGRVEWMKRRLCKGLVAKRVNEQMNAVNERTNKWTTINPGGYARGALAVKYSNAVWKRRTQLR